MKNLKVMIIASVAMIGLSSCLGGNSNSTSQIPDIVKVDNSGYGMNVKSYAYPGFTVLAKNPEELLKIKSQFASVLYELKREEQDLTSKKIKVQLLRSVDINRLYQEIDSTLFEENSAMGPMSWTDNDVVLFDKENLVLALVFPVKEATLQEVDKHQFVLVKDEANSTPDTLKLRLMHKYVEDKIKGGLLQHNFYVYLPEFFDGQAPKQIEINYKKYKNSEFEMKDATYGTIKLNYENLCKVVEQRGQ